MGALPKKRNMLTSQQGWCCQSPPRHCRGTKCRLPSWRYAALATVYLPGLQRATASRARSSTLFCFALLAGPPPPQSPPSVRRSQRPPPCIRAAGSAVRGAKRCEPTHVTVYQLHVTLDKQHTAKSGSKRTCQGGCEGISDADCPLDDVLGVVKKDLCNNHAVILLNAPKASYAADVMVLLPRGRLLLLQCKYYTKTKLYDGLMPKLSLTKWNWRIPQRSCCKASSPRIRRACVTTSFE